MDTGNTQFSVTDSVPGLDDAAVSTETQQASPDAIEEPAPLDDLNYIPPEEGQQQETAPETEHKPATDAQGQAKPAIPETLPEGVTVSEASGKKIYNLNEHRYRNFEGAYKTLRNFEKTVGQAITPEALEGMYMAHDWAERMHSNVLSGDPQGQAEFVQHWIGEARRAQKEGKITGDPIAPLARTFSAVLKREAPEAYHRMVAGAIPDVLDAFYQMAMEAPEGRRQSLVKAAQWIESALNNGKFRKFEELNNPAAHLDERERGIQERERAIANRDAQAAGEFRDRFTNTVTEAYQTGIQKEIMTALEPVQKAYENYPRSFDGIVTNLKKAVNESINKDSVWQARMIAELREALSPSTSHARRQALAQSIVLRHINKAKQIIPDLKEEIIREANGRIKADNSAAHERRSTLESKREPGSGAQVKQSVMPNGKGRDYTVATKDDFKADLDRLLGS